MSNAVKNEEIISDRLWLGRALDLARQAYAQGEVPIGAVIVCEKNLLGCGFNRPIASNDPTAHAEIIALRQAALTVNNYRILNATLYVTLEPCAMCVGAMLQARIKRLVFGAYDAKAGAVQSVWQLLDAKVLNHRIEYRGGIMAEECTMLLMDFFRNRR